MGPPLPANSKEPVITEDMDDFGDSEEDLDSELTGDDLSFAIDNAAGKTKGARTALKCRSLRIGSYKVLMPTEKVIFVPEGIRLMVPRMSQGSKKELVKLDIPMRKIVKVLAHFRRSLPVFFVYARPSVGNIVQNALNMTDPEGFYYDPCSSDESQRRITILPDRLTEDSRIIFKELFKTASTSTRASQCILDELDQKETNEILLRSSPQLPGTVSVTTPSNFQGSSRTIPSKTAQVAGTTVAEIKAPQQQAVTTLDNSNLQVVHIPGIGQVQILQPTTPIVVAPETATTSPTKQQQSTQESTVSSSVTSTRRPRKILPKGAPIINAVPLEVRFTDSGNLRVEPEEPAVDDILSTLTNRYKNKKVEEEEDHSIAGKYKNDDEDDDEDYVLYPSRNNKKSAYEGPGSYKRLQENKSNQRKSQRGKNSRLDIEDEEDEQEFSIEEDLRIGTRINLGTGMTKPIEAKRRKEPIITADMENSEEEKRQTVKGEEGKRKKELTSSLKCRSLRIGSYKVLMPKDKVIFTPEGITMKAPTISEGNSKEIVTINIPSTKIVKILGHFGRFLPVFFVYVKPSVGTMIRNALNMTDPDGFYFDPCSEDESQKTLTILPDKFLEGSRSVYKEIFKSQDILDELDQKEANEILFRSSPKENLSNKSMNKSRTLEEKDNSTSSSKKIKADQPNRKTNIKKKKKQLIIQQEGGPPIVLEVDADDEEEDADDPDEIDEDMGEDQNDKLEQRATGASSSPSTSFGVNFDDMDEDMNSSQDVASGDEE